MTSDAALLLCDEYGGGISASLQAPKAYQVCQVNGSGLTSIPIVGRVLGGGRYDVRASWDGGQEFNIAPGVAGSFSGKLVNQPAGQGTLVMCTTNVEVANVLAGHVFIVAGQSNADGRGTNLRSYSHASLKAGMYRNGAWSELADPTGEDPTPFGSVWPLVATDLLTTLGVPCGFVPTAKGGTAISTWAAGTANYNRMIQRARDAGAPNGVKMVLWWQGESDAAASITKAAYETAINNLANSIYSDLGVPLLPAKLQTSSTAAWNATNVNNAITDAATSNDHILPPVDLSALSTDDADHLKSNANLAAAAALWSAGILANM